MTDLARDVKDARMWTDYFRQQERRDQDALIPPSSLTKIADLLTRLADAADPPGATKVTVIERGTFGEANFRDEVQDRIESLDLDTATLGKLLPDIVNDRQWHRFTITVTAEPL